VEQNFEGFCSGVGITRLAKNLANKALNEGKTVAWETN
jgi:hypothetical protein